ncbi:MAG: TonB-dependent receptor, partial [Bacteroidia bacterium]|nr:TonB-dependent receptor [Bacteroidia bacterium]
ANTFKFEYNYNKAETLKLRTAYKYYDVQTDYLSGKLEKPLVPTNRVFANLAYETKRTSTDAQWKFDATYNWLSSQRYPNTEQSAIQLRLPDRTPSFGTLNLQVTKVFSSNFELYIGGENVTDVRQDNPIVSADNPFGPNFDTTFVYGPIFGSMYYAGLRYRIN